MEDGKGEPDGVLSLSSDAFGPVHPFADIGGDLFVEVVLERGQLVRDGLGDALGKEFLALEGEQVFLDHAAHDAAGVGGDLVLAFEPVFVEQREEQLKVLFLPECGVAVINNR